MKWTHIGISAACLSLAFSIAAEEVRVWDLPAIESQVLKMNPALRSLSLDKELLQSERSLIDSRFQPQLSAHAGIASENTEDEQRSGPLLYLDGRWNIYRGGRDQLARQRTDAGAKALNFELETEKRGLLLTVRSLYAELLATQLKQELIGKEIKVNAAQKSSAHRRTMAGVATMADELEFMLRGEELEGQVKSLQSHEKKILLQLKNLMQMPLSESLRMKAQFSDLTALATRMYEAPGEVSHPRLLRMQEELTLRELESAEVAASYRPEIAAFASVGRLTPTLEREEGGLESVVGLSLSLPLYDGFQQRSSREAAALNKRKSEIESEKIRIELKGERESVTIEKEELQRLRELNEKRLSYAERYLDVTLQEYERGVKNSPDVLGATEHVFSSKIRQVELALQAALLGAKSAHLRGAP